MIIWNSLKLFQHIHGYLLIFANTEIYVIEYKTHWKIVKTTFDNSSDVFVIEGFTVPCKGLFVEWVCTISLSPFQNNIQGGHRPLIEI